MQCSTLEGPDPFLHDVHARGDSLNILVFNMYIKVPHPFAWNYSSSRLNYTGDGIETIKLDVTSHTVALQYANSAPSAVRMRL
jgi:hypothetical protein